MSKVDFFGHFFYASLFLGMLLLSAKDYRGWVFRFLGEAGWIVIGLAMGMSSIVVWGIIFMVVDVWGYLEWSSDKEILAMSEKPEDFEDIWDTSPDCDDKIHIPECRHFKPIENGTYTMKPGELIVYDPSRSTVKKEKKNVKRKVKAKRNSSTKLQSQRKAMATANSRPANIKVRAGGRRSSK